MPAATVRSRIAMPQRSRKSAARARPPKPGPITPTTNDRFAGIGDAAVQRATGRAWAEWFAILDAAGALKWPHMQIAAWLHEHHGANAGDWWSQMVTVGYEQARGLRDANQKPDGYSASASKTIGVPLAALYKAWSDARQRTRWLGSVAITIRKATVGRSMRITWSDGRTNVDVNFYAKGRDKCSVSVQHDKLPNAAAAQKMKSFWQERLVLLQRQLSAGA